MPIATYTDLQSAIADFLARSDLNARIPDFITLTEGRLNRSLRTVEMEASVAQVVASGVVPVPTDYLEWIAVRWIGARTQDVCFVEPDSAEWRFRYRPNGDPQMFSIIANNIETRPVPTDGDTVKLYYYQKIPALATFTTNWLLTKAPDLYLYSAIAEACAYMKDEQRAAEYFTLAKGEQEKATMAADVNKTTMNQGRPMDTGAGATRAYGQLPPSPLPQ